MISYSESEIIEERIPNSQIVKKYLKGKLLGKGGFAKCYQFTSLDTNKLYAAKIIEKNSLVKPKAKEKLTSEIKIHKSLKFQYIVGFEHFFEDETCVYILLELCPNQTLNELIKRRKRITQLEAQCYLYQIAQAIKYLQTNRVIHRDLKLGNLFLNDKMEIKIGDFGLAAILETGQEKRKTMCGTPNYIAPEILENKGGHSYEVDIWSFGVIAYAILVGRPPFETNDIKSTYNKIRMCNYSFPQTINLSKPIKNLISKMLQLDPARRLTIDEILSHQFFTVNPFPRCLPISTLACPPNSVFLKKFIPDADQITKCTQLNTSRGMLKTDAVTLKRTHSVQQKDMEIVDKSLQKRNPPQRAVSSLALNNYKYIVKKNQMAELVVENKGPELWVTHCTFDPRFGLAYFLNSKTTGVYFLDNSCVLTTRAFNKTKYFELDKNLMESNSKFLEKSSNDPKLDKRLRIAQHFEQILLQTKEREELTMNNQEIIRRERLRYKKETVDNFARIYVKKYHSSSKGYIFLFNNKDTQFIFTDKTEVLIKNENVVYVNKYSERKNYLLADIDNMPNQVQKRVSYAQKIIKSIEEKKQSQNSQKQNLSKQSNQQESKGNMTKRQKISLDRKEPPSQSIERKQLKRNTSYSRYNPAERR